MIWPFKQDKKRQAEIDELIAKSEEMVKRAAKYEQAALDGEEQWMLVKCKPKSKVDHPLRRETDVVCVT